MTEADIRYSKKLAAAKAWLQKIENQGVMDFGSADSLTCDKSINIGQQSVTHGFIIRLAEYTPSATQLLFSSSAANIRYNFTILSSGNWQTYIKTSELVAAIPLNVALVDGHTLLAFLSMDRSGSLDLYIYDLDEPNNIWGLIGAADISASEGDDIIGTSDAIIFEGADTIGLCWPLPMVNRAMTGDEITALVEGIMAPNSWPADLQDVGALDISMGTGVEATSYDNFTSFTGLANGFSAVNGSTGSRAIVPFDSPYSIGSGDVVYLQLKATAVTGNIAVYGTGSSAGGGIVPIDTISIEGAGSYFYELSFTSAHTLHGILFVFGDSESLDVESVRVHKPGQIFDIRPTRSGTHIDGTGNGYTFTSTGTPTIKPFAAGIQ